MTPEDPTQEIYLTYPTYPYYPTYPSCPFFPFYPTCPRYLYIESVGYLDYHPAATIRPPEKSDKKDREDRMDRPDGWGVTYGSHKPTRSGFRQ